MNDSNYALIIALTDHEMAAADTVLWRNRLVSDRVFTTEEAAALSQEALAAAYRTRQTMLFAQMHESQLLKEVERRRITWSVDMPADYQQGAICY